MRFGFIWLRNLSLLVGSRYWLELVPKLVVLDPAKELIVLLSPQLVDDPFSEIRIFDGVVH